MNFKNKEYVFVKSECQFGYIQSLPANDCHVAFDLGATKKLLLTDLIKIKSYDKSIDSTPAIDREDFELLKKMFLNRVDYYPREISDFDIYVTDEDGFVLDVELRKPLLEAKRANRSFANFFNALKEYAKTETLDAQHIRFEINPRDELTSRWLMSQLDLFVMKSLTSAYSQGQLTEITPEAEARRIADLTEAIKNIDIELFELDAKEIKDKDDFADMGKLEQEKKDYSDAIAAYKGVNSSLVLSAEKWSGGVKLKWKPEEGFFKEKSAEEIAKGAKSGHSGDVGAAIKALQFYINRNPDGEYSGKVKHAEEILHRQLKQSIQVKSSWNKYSRGDRVLYHNHIWEVEEVSNYDDNIVLKGIEDNAGSYVTVTTDAVKLFNGVKNFNPNNNIQVQSKKESDPSAKAPKKWWDQKIKEVKSGNPSYSEERVKETVGSIWTKLSDSKKSEIREREGKTYAPVK